MLTNSYNNLSTSSKNLKTLYPRYQTPSNTLSILYRRSNNLSTLSKNFQCLIHVIQYLQELIRIIQKSYMPYSRYPIAIRAYPLRPKISKTLSKFSKQRIFLINVFQSKTLFNVSKNPKLPYPRSPIRNYSFYPKTLNTLSTLPNNYNKLSNLRRNLK